MNKKLLALMALLLTLMLVLAACNSDDESTKPADEPDKTEEGAEEGEEGAEEDAEQPASDDLFPVVLDNEGEAIEGGTLQVALVNDSPFQGIFAYTLYEDAYDDEIMRFASNSLFDTDGDFLLTDTGIGSLTVDGDNNKATIKIKEGVKWSDGEPLKIEDLIQPYLIIGHKDYTNVLQGVRYDSDFQNIIGAVEYHDGKADTISGLKKVDETTLEISFNKVSPAIYSGGDGLWGYAEPSHILKDIPVAELLEHDAIRKNPVTLGAFKFT